MAALMLVLLGWSTSTYQLLVAVADALLSQGRRIRDPETL